MNHGAFEDHGVECRRRVVRDHDVGGDDQLERVDLRQYGGVDAGRLRGQPVPIRAVLRRMRTQDRRHAGHHSAAFEESSDVVDVARKDMRGRPEVQGNKAFFGQAQVCSR